MITNQQYAEMSMEEFIALPNTIDLVLKYNEAVIDFASTRPYLRLGNNVADLFVIVYLQQENLNRFLYETDIDIANVLPIILGLTGRAALEASGIIEVQQQPYLDLSGQGTLMGFIDTGIDYTNEAFIYEDRTSKVKSLWDQTIPGNAPEGYYFGTEYTDTQINEALQSQNPYDIVPSRDTVGHGTFLASIAASRQDSEYIGAAPDADLIIVKLKKANPFAIDYYLIPPDQQNAYESSDVMLALEYIVEKAFALRRPVSICIGIGSNSGSHDGLHPLEIYLTLLCYRSAIAVNAAAGNESNMRHHTLGFLQNAGDSQDIEIKVGDRGGSVYMNIWNNPSDQLSVSVTSPTGEVIERIPFKTGTTLETKLVLEKSRIIIKYVFPAEGSVNQLTNIKIIDATPGIWRITVYGDIILNGLYHAWLPMTGLGYAGIEFLTPDPDYTIVTPAAAFGTITSGAYDNRDNSLYASSSWGPSRGQLSAPLLTAPGVDVLGIYPIGFGTMTGTSVAAAITAGASALMLQWGIVNANDYSMNSFVIQSYLAKGCERDPNIVYPNTQWGFGRLNLMNTFTEMSK